MNFLQKLLFRKKNSNQTAEITIYYRKLCQDCDKVKEYLDQHKIAYNYVDCEENENSLPFPIMATPALVKGNELLAYGVDIIHYLK